MLFQYKSGKTDSLPPDNPEKWSLIEASPAEFDKLIATNESGIIFVFNALYLTEYGNQKGLAKRMRVGERTIQHWTAGDRIIRPVVIELLKFLYYEKYPC